MRLIISLLMAVALFGQTAKYPTAIATDADLLKAKDRTSSTLASDITAATLAVPVASGTSFVAYGVVTIDAEQMQVCSVVGGTLNICAGTRGFGGTVAATHSSGATVRGQIVARYHNALSEEIKAIQTSLGVSLANVLNQNTAGNAATATLATTATSTLGFRSGAALPATCTAGEYYTLTTGPKGQGLYQCTASNTWGATTNPSEYYVVSYGADATGVADSTVAINAAMTAGAGKTVVFPAGSYKAACVAPCAAGAAIVPASGTVLKGAGQTLNNTIYTTKITNYAAAYPLFRVPATGTVISDMMLLQDSGTTATAGNAGILVDTSAISAEFRNLYIGRFYYGVDCTGGGGQTSLENIEVQSSESHGYVSRLCQGYWRVVNATSNKGNGFYLTSGVGGSQPWLLSGGTYGNGGYGIYSDVVGVTGVDGFFVNNDSLGGIRLTPDSSDAGFVTNSQLQWAGLNPNTAALNPADVTSNKLSSQVVAATNAADIEITVAAAHGLTGPTLVDCHHLGGNIAGNGTFTATPVGIGSPTKFTLGVAGNGALSIPATCPTAGVYGYECPKCSLASTTYRSLPTAPGIQLDGPTGGEVNGANSVIISNNKMLGSNGTGIKSTALFTSVIGNSVLSSGGGGVAGNLYSMDLTGGYATVSSNRSDGPANIGAGYDIITNNTFSGLISTPAHLPALNIPHGSATGYVVTFNGNDLLTGGSTASLEISDDVRYNMGKNYTPGTVTDAGQPSSDMFPKYLYSYPVAFANLPTGSGAYDGTIQACSNCQVTSAVDNTCKAGGVGAIAMRLNGAWRCFWNPAGGSGDVLGSANLTTAGYPVTVSAAGTVTQAAILGSAVGGTGNGFAKFAGPAAAEKTFTLPNASATILTSNAAVTVPQGGTGLAAGTSGGVPFFDSATTLASSAPLAQYKVLVGSGPGAAPASIASAGTAGQVFVSGGAAANPGWTSAVPVCQTYTVAYDNAAFVAAASAVSVVLGTLPAKGKVTGVTIKHSVQYSDGAGAMTAVTASLGDGTTHTAYSAAQGIGESVAVADTTFTDTAQFKSTTTLASTLTARFTATGRNFGDGAGATYLTGGSVAFSVCAVTLP